jgi:ankyrin repeat protein
VEGELLYAATQVRLGDFRPAEGQFRKALEVARYALLRKPGLVKFLHPSFVKAAAYFGLEGLAELFADSVPGLANWAAAGGQVGLLKKLIERGHVPTSHEALLEAPAEALRLIASALGPGYRLDAGWTLLHVAAARCDPDLVKSLVEAGADVNAEDGDGCTPLCRALSSGRCSPWSKAAAAAALVGAGAAVTARELRLAVSGIDVFSVVSAGYRGDLADPCLLLHAVERGAPEVVAVVLGAGARPAGRGRCGVIALVKAAAKRCNRDVVEILLHAGAVDPRARLGRAKKTPLHIAAEAGCPAAVELLLKYGADVNARDARGSTPLHAAAAAGKPESVRALLEGGADPRARDGRGRTPLDVARGAARAALLRLS